MARAWVVPGLLSHADFRDAAGRVILTRWCEMMSHREGTLLGEDVEELHAMRVSSRRLRAAMDGFEAVFPRRSYRPFRRQVKEITDVLGRARDLDVATERLIALAPSMADDERPGIDGMIARYRDERSAESPRIAALFAGIDTEGFERQLAKYIARHTGVKLAALAPGPGTG